jgi:hypothetical protein
LEEILEAKIMSDFIKKIINKQLSSKSCIIIFNLLKIKENKYYLPTTTSIIIEWNYMINYDKWHGKEW